MDVYASCEERLRRCLQRFLAQSRSEAPDITNETDLVSELGLTSDEGVDLVLDLCDEFQFEFAGNFNPVVHESGRRGRRFGELVQAVTAALPAEEAAR